MNGYQKMILTIMVFVSSFHCVHESASKTVVPETRKMLGRPTLSLTVPLTRHFFRMAIDTKLQPSPRGSCISPTPRNAFFFGSKTYCSDAGKSSGRIGNLSVVRYVRYLRLHWAPIPVGVGLALIALQHYWRVRRREAQKSSSPAVAQDWEITCYKMIPLRALSRSWGYVNSLELPHWARQPVLSWYIRTFGCNLKEAEVEDLHKYKNLGEFFRRKLKEGMRPVEGGDCIVSPADGTVLHLGKVESDRVEQVKGITYSLSTFLGPRDWEKEKSEEKYYPSLLTNKEHQLYHCVIYLAPGDYHRFHSPVTWDVNCRRHFPGQLFSVKPTIARWIAGLFNLNERAVYVGRWRYGFFSMAAVGATNVGSINVYFDRELQTNKVGRFDADDVVNHTFPNSVKCRKGESFGEFNLGSTIVLIFEAPKDFQFKIAAGDKVRVGQAINFCLDSANDKNEQRGCVTQ